ncbi:predicted protein [Chaetoceros tenuissimus]|uniref:Uncharacterized protein n=1 Tax=Chaetoceros tenuissimus TaxID=426638 RepID=A0AAD3D548_9STRA|nr:predicted protein [Chaetoceros tenuissimus]
MCAEYSLGIILLWIAAVMEIEMADVHTNVAAALWIVGGIAIMIGQMYLCKTLSMWFAYIPAIIASLLFAIARGILGIDHITKELTITKVFVYEDFIRYKEAQYTAQEFSDLQAKLMISGSVLYIIHAFLFYTAVNGKINSMHESMQTEETSVHRNIRSSLRNKAAPHKTSSYLDLGDQLK